MVRLHAPVGLLRVRRAGRTLIQSTIAAGSAWALAGLLPHHPRPYFAPIAAVITISLTIGQHSRRAVEIASGVALGVLVGDGLVNAVGVGGWQIALGVGLAMTLAVFLGGSGLVMNQAASSAVLITAVPLAPGVTFYSRFVDAIVGGGIGVLVSLAVPLRPFTVVKRAAAPLLSTVVAELEVTEHALREGDVTAASASLDRLRATEPLLREVEAAVTAGRETARLAPARRSARMPIAQIAEIAVQLDRAVRNLRVLVRRSIRLIEDAPQQAALIAPALLPLTEAFRVLSIALDDLAKLPEAREDALDAVWLAEAARYGADDLSAAVVVAQVRSIAVDVLRASGLDEHQAIALVRAPST